MRKAQSLLELARQKYPEQFNQHHGLYLSDDGTVHLAHEETAA